MNDPPSDSHEKRTYTALTLVGLLAVLAFGPMQSSLLRQDEMAGMGAAMILVVLILPLLGAFVWAVVLSGTGVNHGPARLRRRLLLWYGCVVLFPVQLVLLDPYTGHGPLPRLVVIVFGILGFGSLLAALIMPVWWRRHIPAVQPPIAT